MRRDEIENLVETWARAVSACDVEALARLVSPPLCEGVVGRTRAVHGAFADVQVTPVQVVIDGDSVAWRWRLVGIHVGALGGVAASGERRSLDGVNVQRVRNGVVVDHWTMVDLAALARGTPG